MDTRQNLVQELRREERKTILLMRIVELRKELKDVLSELEEEFGWDYQEDAEEDAD